MRVYLWEDTLAVAKCSVAADYPAFEAVNNGDLDGKADGTADLAKGGVSLCQ